MNLRQNKKMKKSNKNLFPVDLNKENTNPNDLKAFKIEKEFLPTDYKKKRNQSYDNMISRSYTKIVLPDFLQPTSQSPPEIQHYESQILDYIIKQHQFYKFSDAIKQRIFENSSKRIAKIDKMFKIYKRFKLKRKTFQLAVYYYDRYINQLKNRRQSASIEEACMLIAMKYEEIYPPNIAKWTSLLPSKLIQLQSKILLVLNFKLAYTTTYDYLQFYYAQNTTSGQQKRLHEILLQFYLFNGHIYNLHPLKMAQEIMQAFRPTLFIEKDTEYYQRDRKLKWLIKKDYNIWSYLLLCMEKYLKK